MATTSSRSGLAAYFSGAGVVVGSCAVFPGSKTLACPIGCVPRSEVREAFLRDALALSKLKSPPETRSFARVLRRRSRLLSGSYAPGIVIGVASLSSVAIPG